MVRPLVLQCALAGLALGFAPAPALPRARRRPRSALRSTRGGDAAVGPFNVGSAEFNRVVGEADAASGGFLLSYADLRPYDETTAGGKWFVATNVAFACAGVVLAANGNTPLAVVTEAAGLLSYNYHYKQISNDRSAPEVKFALFIDYIGAFSAIIGGLRCVVEQGGVESPVFYVASFLSFAMLFCGWIPYIYASSELYMLTHGLWHVFGAVAAATLTPPAVAMLS